MRPPATWPNSSINQQKVPYEFIPATENLHYTQSGETGNILFVFDS